MNNINNNLNYYFQNYKKNIFLLKDIFKKIIYTLLFIFIIKTGYLIPNIGINLSKILKILKYKNNSNIINIYDIISIKNIKKVSIFNLGITSYITSSLLIDFFSIFINYFKKLKKNNNFENKKKIKIYKLLFMAIFSILYSLINLSNIYNIKYIKKMFFMNKINLIIFINSIILNNFIIFWLKNKITYYGISKGTSIITLINIINKIPKKLKLRFIKNKFFSFINIYNLIFFYINILLLMIFITLIEYSNKKILINYPKKIFLSNFFSILTKTYLPIKINMSGITPYIFSKNIIFLIKIILIFIKNKINNNYIKINILKFINNNIINNIINIILIFIFCKLYNNITYDSKKISINLKKSNYFIQYIRPGNNTSFYIKNIINKISFINSIYINFIYLYPKLIEYITEIKQINGYYLLIIIITTIEILTNFQSIIINNKYIKIFNKFK